MRPRDVVAAVTQHMLDDRERVRRLRRGARLRNHHHERRREAGPEADQHAVHAVRVGVVEDVHREAARRHQRVDEQRRTERAAADADVEHVREQPPVRPAHAPRADLVGQPGRRVDRLARCPRAWTMVGARWGARSQK
jgi:hypothetical protein